MLALGALLVIEGKASGGIIIAGSILVTRALAPAEMAIANWKGLVNARQALARIKTFLNSSPQRGTPLALDPSPDAIPERSDRDDAGGAIPVPLSAADRRTAEVQVDRAPGPGSAVKQEGLVQRRQTTVN